jgi:hypothetical protein
MNPANRRQLGAVVATAMVEVCLLVVMCRAAVTDAAPRPAAARPPVTTRRSPSTDALIVPRQAIAGASAPSPTPALPPRAPSPKTVPKSESGSSEPSPNPLVWSPEDKRRFKSVTLQLELDSTWKTDLAENGGLVGVSTSGDPGSFDLVLDAWLRPCALNAVADVASLVFEIQNGAPALVTLRGRVQELLGDVPGPTRFFLLFSSATLSQLEERTLADARRQHIELGAGATVICAFTRQGQLRVIEIVPQGAP